MIPVIFAHPDPASLTASLANEACRVLREAGGDPVIVDLYRCDEGGMFPPILEAEEMRRKTSLEPVVQKQMSLLERAAGFLVVHPDWWGGPPAILKGWIDRVLRPGSAYEVPEGYGRRESEGMLQGRKALVIVPGDSEESGILEEFWIKRVWGFCGVDARLIYLPNYSKSGRIEKQKNLIIAGEAVKETFL